MNDGTKSPPVPHVRTPKPLYDDFIAARWTGNEAKVYHCVLRFTIGHRGQADGAYISRSFIADRTRLHVRTVRTILERLVADGVILRLEPASGRRPPKLAVQMDSSLWGAHAPAVSTTTGSTRRQTTTTQTAQGPALKVDPLTAQGRAPTGRKDAPSSGPLTASPPAHSEEQPEAVLLEDGECGDLEESPLCQRRSKTEQSSPAQI